MLTKNEERYILWWKDQREIENSAKFKLLNGLPLAILFSLPILISIFVVQLFSPDWFAKLQDVKSSMAMILIAVLLIILFTAFIRMHFRWEKREQTYMEILAKQDARAANHT